MKTMEMTIEDVRDAGMSALFDALGPANALRFLQLFQPGTGDYTRDRRKWLDSLSLEDILEDIKRIQGDTTPSDATAAKS